MQVSVFIALRLCDKDIYLIYSVVHFIDFGI